MKVAQNYTFWIQASNYDIPYGLNKSFSFLIAPDCGPGNLLINENSIKPLESCIQTKMGEMCYQNHSQVIIGNFSLESTGNPV